MTHRSNVEVFYSVGKSYSSRRETPQGCHVRELHWTDGDGRERTSVELAAETLALAPDWQREQGRCWPA